VDHDFVRRLDEELYEIGSEANRDEGRRRIVVGGG